VRLIPPDFGSPAPSKPAVAEERGTTPALPVGIAQFAIAKEQVASGLKPDVEGVQWLQDNGYRTVVFVRRTGEDDTAERKIFEGRGLKYLSLESSPDTLSSAVEKFNQIVADKSGHPLFVYDKDGTLAGALWYLHFRTVDKAADEEARTKASRLGLKEDKSEDQRLLWLAIQKYLGEQNK
jgi:protein tyrosine phosphatase (PTP) superfamily phosphohydrolase (DUF442 family)